MQAANVDGIKLALTPGNPFPGYRQLRDNAPVLWSEEAQTWVVSRYDDIAGVLKNREAFRQVQYSSYSAAFASEHQMMVEFDEPQHMQIRHVFTEGGSFSRVSIHQRIGREMERIAHEAVLALPEGEPFDGVVSFAPAVSEMIATFLGFPVTNDSDFDWTTSLVGSYPSSSRSTYPAELAFIQTIVDSRKQSPGSDLVSQFLDANKLTQAVDDGQLTQNLWGMAIEGGHVTMTQLGMALHSLAQLAPGTAILSFADESSARIAVEELCRFAPALHYLERISTREIDVAGVRIGEGEAVCVLLASGNRDERKWKDPGRLDLARPLGPPILNFGNGPHMSPGSTLARMILEALLRAFFDRFSDVRLEGEFQQELMIENGLPYCFIPVWLPLTALG